MNTLTFRPKTPDDDEWLVATRNRLSDHLPPGSVEAFRHWERVDLVAEQAHTERFIVEQAGQRVGSFFVEKMWWTARPGGWWCGLSVHPDHWNQGIGAWMYDQLSRKLTEVGAERAYTNVRNDRPHAQRFAEKRGFTKTGHADRWSRLEVRSADLEGYAGVEEALA